MLNRSFAKKVAARMLIIAGSLVALFIFCNFAVSTDRIWLLAALPFLCTIPPALHNIYWRDLVIDKGKVRGPMLAVGTIVPRLFVMNCVVYGLAVAIPSLAITIAATTCYFTPVCIMPI